MSDTQVTVIPDAMVIKVIDRTSPTVDILVDPKIVTVEGAVRPIINVAYSGGRGPIWLPGNTYDGTSLAAILTGYIGKQQLSGDLSESLSAVEVGLADAVRDLSDVITNNAATGQLLDDVESRLTVAEESITSQVSRLTAAEANISTTLTEMDGHELRLSVAEADVNNHNDYIATQQSMLSNEWTVKIQENADGTSCVAGMGLLVYPAWKIDTVYDVDDYVWFDGHAYKAVISHTATEANVPPNASYWLLIPYATKSQFGVLAESFFVQTGTGEKGIPFLVQDDQIMVNGDMMVNGLIKAGMLDTNKVYTWSIQSKNYVPGVSGYAINSLTGHVEFNDMDLTINYSSISGAPNSLAQIDADASAKLGTIAPNADVTQYAIDKKVDTTTGGIIVRDISLERYAQFTGGDLEFYDLVNSDWILSKSVTSIRSGVCQNGATVNIGYFRSQPTVILSPYNLQSYNGSYQSQSQTFKLEANNLRKSGVNWLFDAVAQLVLSNGSTTTLGGNATATLPASTGSGTFASTIKTGKTVTIDAIPPAVTLASNTRQVSVNLLLRQRYTFSYTIGKFKVPVRVVIRLQYLSGGNWVTGATTELAGVTCVSLVERTASISYTSGVDITSIRIVATFISDINSTATSIDMNTPIYNTMFASITQITSQQAAATVSAAGYASYLAIG